MADKTCLDSASLKANSSGLSKITSFMPTCQWQGVMMASGPKQGAMPMSLGASSCGMRKALDASVAWLKFLTYARRLSNFSKLGKYNVSIAFCSASDPGAA